ncbi:MAG: dihydroorotate dehydrogenase electron transfer subunit [Treponema sp.]|nr:dihydroorotate dehydrogenase electron transfer subunit [Treponema sp.]
MSEAPSPACENRELLANITVSDELFRLDFSWDPCRPPKAGQFFMLKPLRSGVLLPRAISLAAWQPERGIVSFLIAQRGEGTRELADLRPGEKARLIGPLGNAWADFLAEGSPAQLGRIALVGGGVGAAPLLALLRESGGKGFDFYAGFRSGAWTKAGREAFFLGALDKCESAAFSSEDGSFGRAGRITDFVNPGAYAAVFACGPEAMMRAVYKKCAAASVTCIVSMESRMACGVGACKGCSIRVRAQGAERSLSCCAEGPIFDAREGVLDG